MSDDNKIGALWLKEDKNGKKYMSGLVGEIKVVVFKNNYKKEDKHPDYIVYEQKENYSKEKKQEDEEIPF
jgi:uncharacterized protein (DUF736 family)